MAFRPPIDFSRPAHGNRVARLRNRMNPVPTPAELAQAVGCSDEQIRKLERGFNNPGLRLARRLSAVLGASLDEVFPPEAA